jgi:hypothetical protein
MTFCRRFAGWGLASDYPQVVAKCLSTFLFCRRKTALSGNDPPSFRNAEPRARCSDLPWIEEPGCPPAAPKNIPPFGRRFEVFACRR